MTTTKDYRHNWGVLIGSLIFVVSLVAVSLLRPQPAPVKVAPAAPTVQPAPLRNGDPNCGEIVRLDPKKVKE